MAHFAFLKKTAGYLYQMAIQHGWKESPQALSPGLVNRLAKEVGKTATGCVVGRNSQRRGFREEMWVVDGWVESFGHPYWGGIKPIQIQYVYIILYN